MTFIFYPEKSQKCKHTIKFETKRNKAFFALILSLNILQIFCFEATSSFNLFDNNHVCLFYLIYSFDIL